ncbi:MAG: hypothetical protein KJZ79_04550 [Bryobacteraceae bacterium]|nr:hypothetical protein [Bryobacteraceae bacterium]
MSDKTRTDLAAGQSSANAGTATGPKTAQGKARSSLNALKHGRFSRYGSLLQYECVPLAAGLHRAIAAPAIPSSFALHTFKIDPKSPSETSQLIHSKQLNFGSNLGSNPFRTPDEPLSDPERTPSEPHSDPIRTTPDTHSNS